jgi:DNA-binding NarL/FixJ family response regulator
MRKKPRILLADDHPVVREGLKALVSGQPDMQVVGDVADGRSAVEQAPQRQPDVIIMGISMPDMNGIQATKELQRVCPEARIVAQSVHEDTSYLRELLAAGASGYVIKCTAAAVLLQAIRPDGERGLWLSATPKTVRERRK